MTETPDNSLLEAWQRGELTDDQALHALCGDLSEIENQAATLEAQAQALRDQIGQIVAQRDNRVALAGFGTLTIRAPSKVTTYDRGKLDELVQSLRETGYGDIADEITSCMKTTMRAGGLSITRERKQAAD